MIYIIKKMFKTCGDYVNIYHELYGVNPIFNKIYIPLKYPSKIDIIGSLEYASTVHKEVRRFLQLYLRPGIKLLDIAKLIEFKTIELSNQSKSINKGIGFPVGLSVNECSAHYHPTSSDNSILTKDDIIKIDFGTEANGWIIDSAFTVCFDPKYNQLIAAVKAATQYGLANIGVDVNIGEWGKEIQEVMESYEITLNGKTHHIRAINNLGGHNITKGIIHGKIFLPIVDMRNTLSHNNRFKEGVYAVETFGSTGDNYANEIGESTLYRINPNKQLDTSELNSELNSKLNSKLNVDSIKLLNKIRSKFNTLPFTNRYIELFNMSNYKKNLENLSNNNYLHSYPPLYVNKGAYTAQYEHTVYISENKKIIFSRGEDY
jgi:methionyl aminopeptidase